MSRPLSIICLVLGSVLGLALYGETRRVGGGHREPVDINDPEVISTARWATEKLHGTFLDVTNAQKQVVAGLIYYITMNIESHRQMDLECSVKVWVRHWLKRATLMRSKCTPVLKGIY